MIRDDKRPQETVLVRVRDLRDIGDTVIYSKEIVALLDAYAKVNNASVNRRTQYNI
jgi:hypothetical protein